jgi:hypothetical protein
MAKRKISAKEAVAAIRLGMDDSALMKEYGLARSGLQSLFDKLVTGGYLDLAEVKCQASWELLTSPGPSYTKNGTQAFLS